jgi:hypothetical protein
MVHRPRVRRAAFRSCSSEIARLRACEIARSQDLASDLPASGVRARESRPAGAPSARGAPLLAVGVPSRATWAADEGVTTARVSARSCARALAASAPRQSSLLKYPGSPRPRARRHCLVCLSARSSTCEGRRPAQLPCLPPCTAAAGRAERPGRERLNEGSSRGGRRGPLLVRRCARAASQGERRAPKTADQRSPIQGSWAPRV